MKNLLMVGVYARRSSNDSLEHTSMVKFFVVGFTVFFASLYFTFLMTDILLAICNFFLEIVKNFIADAHEVCKRILSFIPLGIEIPLNGIYDIFCLLAEDFV